MTKYRVLSNDGEVSLLFLRCRDNFVPEFEGWVMVVGMCYQRVWVQDLPMLLEGFLWNLCEDSCGSRRR